MEERDQGEEWGTEGYPSEEQSGKVSWLLNKGLSVGKKILVTGFVISSAPLVLPPLVVISVMGFACSVPSGLLLASYVCTEKLMSRLLPGSKPPPFLLGFGTVSSNEEFENEEGVYYVGLKGDIDMGLEEENGRQEDFDQYEGKMEEEPEPEIEVTIEGVRKAEEKELVIEERLNQPTVDEVNVVVVDIAEDEGAPGFDVKKIEVQLCQNTNIGEDEELVRETRGLVEKTRDEGITDIREEDKQRSEELPGDAEVEEQKVNRNDYGNIRMEKPQRVTGLKVEECTNNKIPKEISEVKRTGHLENVEAMPEKIKPAERSATESVGNTTAEEQKSKVDKPAVLQGGRANTDISKSAVQDNQLERKKEIVISTNADAREIADESGFDLYDTKHAVEGNEKSSSYASVETTDNTELPVTAREHESRNASGMSSEKDLGMASSKVILYSEKKLWQQIDAMRKIVGYKAAKHPTCFEELKALYLFTGVEPPASFKDPSDLQDMNDKLRFLMAIVGVK